MDNSIQTVTIRKWNRTLALSIMPVMMVLALIISALSSRSLVLLAKRNLIIESQLHAQLADSWISDSKSKLSVYRNYLEARCVTDEDILDYIVVSNLAHADFPVGVYVGTSENVMLEPNYFKPDENFVVSERPWYAQALNSYDFVMSSPYTDVMLNKPCVTLSVHLKNPPLSPRADVVRVMGADLYLDYLNNLVKEMVDSGSISGGMIVSKEDGRIVANSTGARVGEPLYSQNMEQHLVEMISYADGKCISDTVNGVSYYVNVTSLKEAPWFLISYVSTSNVLSELYLIWGIILVVSVLIAFILFFLLRYYAEKMDLIQNQAVQLSDRLAVQNTFVELIKMLTENDEFDTIINKCLNIIGDFYHADRSYIFTVDYEKKTQSNIYEWCRNGVIPEKDNLQSIPLSVNARWWPLFERNGYVRLDDLSGELVPGSNEYDILNDQKIRSLLAYPFVHDGVITGFIGIDNPGTNKDEVFLLQSAATCVAESLVKKQYTDVLYDRSYKDILTGAKNRRAYFEDLTKLSAMKDLKVGVVFADLNGLKDTNDNQGHEAGDKLIIEVMKFLDHCFDCYHHTVYRVGGDEFVVFVHDIEERAFQKIIGKTLEILVEKPIVSIGDSWISNGDMVERQVADADRLMYMRKKDFYREQKHDRRHRVESSEEDM